MVFFCKNKILCDKKVSNISFDRFPQAAFCVAEITSGHIDQSIGFKKRIEVCLFYIQLVYKIRGYSEPRHTYKGNLMIVFLKILIKNMGKDTISKVGPIRCPVDYYLHFKFLCSLISLISRIAMFNIITKITMMKFSPKTFLLHNINNGMI